MSEPEHSRKRSTEWCYSCNIDLTNRRSFWFSSPEVGVNIAKCFRCGLHHPPILKRSLRVAILVGTVLTLLNQGDSLIMGRVNDSLIWKIPLTYCVPFVVATYGALANNRTKS